MSLILLFTSVASHSILARFFAHKCINTKYLYAATTIIQHVDCVCTKQTDISYFVTLRALALVSCEQTYRQVACILKKQLLFE